MRCAARRPAAFRSAAAARAQVPTAPTATTLDDAGGVPVTLSGHTPTLPSRR